MRTGLPNGDAESTKDLLEPLMMDAGTVTAENA
jgi:hypothetical protein